MRRVGLCRVKRVMRANGSGLGAFVFSGLGRRVRVLVCRWFAVGARCEFWILSELMLLLWCYLVLVLVIIALYYTAFAIKVFEPGGFDREVPFITPEEAQRAMANTAPHRISDNDFCTDRDTLMPPVDAVLHIGTIDYELLTGHCCDYDGKTDHL